MHRSRYLIRSTLAALFVIIVVASSSAVAQDDEKPNVINWSKSSVQETSANCGDFVFKNMRNEHVYSFLVRGKGNGVCVFHADGLTFRYPSNYGPVFDGTRTLFGFARFGSDVLVTWTPGY